MAVAAAVDCLTGVDRASIDGVLFASTTPPFREKQGAALVAKALDLRRNVNTADFAGSLRAGTAALEAAANAVAAGAERNVLVVASDCRMGAPRGALESKLGDGAAAFLVSDAHPIATLEAAFAVADELQDVWRSDGEAYTHTWEDRFIIKEGYTRNLVEAVKGLLEKTGRSPADFARAALYAPDARSLGGVARKLELAPDRLQDALFGRLGNTGAAFAPMLLVAAFSLEVTEHIEKLDPRRGVSGHLARRRPLASYDAYLRSRKLDPREWPPAADLGLSATIRFRERDADIGFVGARCRSCAQLHFPKQRVCYRCHTKDAWEPFRLSDRTGRVLAFTFDYFFPAAEPPTIVVMTEVEGCRVQVQMANAKRDSVRLDMPVEFAFRKIHDSGGKPNYFWKAVPLEEASP
jgi:uncharacterized OB-fold protein/3-oxoacyl-[acyl-carrier-protein] synthase III